MTEFLNRIKTVDCSWCVAASYGIHQHERRVLRKQAYEIEQRGSCFEDLNDFRLRSMPGNPANDMNSESFISQQEIPDTEHKDLESPFGQMFAAPQITRILCNRVPLGVSRCTAQAMQGSKDRTIRARENGFSGSLTGAPTSACSIAPA